MTQQETFDIAVIGAGINGAGIARDAALRGLKVIVFDKNDMCSGCSYCTQACPYEVPVMWEGKSSKCDACAETVRAGGRPWCVQTCPSDALMYGTREEVHAEAFRRLEKLRASETPTIRAARLEVGRSRTLQE